MEMMVSPNLSLAPFWSIDLPEEVRGTPAIADLDRDGREEVVFADLSGVVRAVRGTDGSSVWSFSAGSPVSAPPAVADIDGDGALEVVIGTWGGDLLALRGRGGGVLWRRTSDRAVRVKPALLPCGDTPGADVIAADFSNTVFRLDGRKGEPRWETRLPVCPLTPFARGIVSSPVLADIDGEGTLEITLGTRAKRVFALDTESGRILWQRRLRYGSDSSPVAFPAAGGVMIAIGSGESLDGLGDNALYALEGAGGRVLWRAQTSGGIDSSPVVYPLGEGGELAIAFTSLADASIRAVRASDGTLLWRYRIGPTEDCRHDEANVCVPHDRVSYLTEKVLCGSYVTPLVTDLDGDGRREVVAGCNNGTLFVLDALNGRLRLSLPLGGPIRPSPLVSDLDGDGRSEMVVMAGRRLHALKLPALCSPHRQYKGDPTNSRDLAAGDPPPARSGVRHRGAKLEAWVSCLTTDVWEYCLFQIEKRAFNRFGLKLRPYFY